MALVAQGCQDEVHVVEPGRREGAQGPAWSIIMLSLLLIIVVVIITINIIRSSSNSST